jgi:hypothetical protein
VTKDQDLTSVVWLILPEYGVRLDRNVVSELSGVEFNDEDVADLAEITALAWGPSARTRLTDEGTMFASYLIETNWNPCRRARDRRRAWVEVVEGVWRDCRRKGGLGSHWDPMNGVHTEREKKASS